MKNSDWTLASLLVFSSLFLLILELSVYIPYVMSSSLSHYLSHENLLYFISQLEDRGIQPDTIIQVCKQNPDIAVRTISMCLGEGNQTIPFLMSSIERDISQKAQMLDAFLPGFWVVGLISLLMYGFSLYLVWVFLVLRRRPIWLLVSYLTVPLILVLASWTIHIDEMLDRWISQELGFLALINALFIIVPVILWKYTSSM